MTAPTIRRLRSGHAIRAVTHALEAGRPRRARALARLFARRSTPSQKLWLALLEAEALFWEGHFARAMALIDARLLASPQLGVWPAIVKTRCLLFEERLDDARTTLASALSEAHAEVRDVREAQSLASLFHYFAGDLDVARVELQAALRETPSHDPFSRILHFALAGIAHRQYDSAATKAHLADAATDGGELFIARWATEKRAELHPDQASAASAPSPNASWLHPLRFALGILLFRPAAYQSLVFAHDQTTALAALNVGLLLLLNCIDYSRGAYFLKEGILLLTAPILLFTITAHLATRLLRQRDAALRMVGGFYSALPALLVLEFAAGRLARSRPVGDAYVVEIFAGVWALAIVLRLLRAVAAPGWARATVCAVLFVATWLLPMHLASRTRLFIARDYRDASIEEDEPPSEQRVEEDEQPKEQVDALVREQDVRLATAIAALEPGRAEIEDLYFVGAAGWSKQDVFLREVRAARQLFDERFDTRGRSLLLSNDKVSYDDLPLCTSTNLGRALNAVGARMNREQDVLFLFITSHGSTRGVAIDVPHRARALRESEIAPRQLRVMLDESGIKWRVLVVSGCMSGVFIDELKDDHTLVATAAASDRNSYGCGTGFAFTDFGRALFDEQFRKSRSFVGAFTRANEVIGEREGLAQRRASRPQLYVGALMHEKLHDLEARLERSAP